MVEHNQTESVMGFNIFSGEVDNLVSELLSLNKTSVVNTINPHSYVVQKSDVEFKSALIESDFILPDGEGIVLAALLVNRITLKKISGADFFFSVMRNLEQKSGKVLFLGATDYVLDKIERRISKDFPSVTVSTFSPEFKPYFDSSDILLFKEKINLFSPDVVFVGLTAPKQEKVIQQLKSCKTPKIYSGIGAVFDFYAGTIQRPSPILVKYKLEWFGRLMREPKRMWRRNFVSTPIFLKDLLFSIVVTNLFKRHNS